MTYSLVVQDQAFELPGARRFSKYLLRSTNRILAAIGPRLLEPEWGFPEGRKWHVKLEDALLGEYSLYGDLKDDKIIMEYCGLIPGYTNLHIVQGNEKREDHHLKENAVILFFQTRTGLTKKPPFFKTKYEGRFDKHKEIPFP